MSEKFFIIMVSAVGLALGILLLVQYLLRSVRETSVEDISNLSLLNRMVFAIEDFFGHVNHKKDFRNMRLEEEMGTIPTEDFNKSGKVTAADSVGKCTTSGKAMTKKKYNMKENM